MKIFQILLILLMSTSPVLGQKTMLKPIDKVRLKIPEPSGLCLGGDSSLYVVSDNGTLFETDFEGKILRKSRIRGMDFEAVFANQQYVFVVDESLRRILKCDQDSLELIKAITHSYAGGRNRGWESLTFDSTRNIFILFTEKNPVIVLELGPDLKRQREEEIRHLPEISGCTYHAGYLWALSDGEGTLFKLDPLNYSILRQWKIPVLNPEGICFHPNGNLLIMSDAMQTLYTFVLPDKNTPK